MKVAATVRFMLVTVALLAPGASPGASPPAQNVKEGPQLQRALNDARLRGKIDMALLLNRYLNSFKISTSVNDGHVTLSGMVVSPIDRELAEQIALAIDGVRSVNNRLSISPVEASPNGGKNISSGFQRIRDVTLTAQVKSRLVLDRHVDAMNIDVDTRDSIVTLKGHVRSARERSLALRIVNNIENVKSVRDELKVVPAS